MRVVLPYTTIYPGVIEAIHADGYEPELVDVSENGRRYRELLSGIWSYGDAFTVVEHDVVVRPGSLPELAHCPEPWCCVPYWNGADYLVGGLGCTRFSRQLLHDAAGMFDVVGRMAAQTSEREDWGRLDTRIRQVLEDDYKLKPHAHWPACTAHLNPKKQTVLAPTDMAAFWNCRACGEAIPVTDGSLSCPACGIIDP